MDVNRQSKNSECVGMRRHLFCRNKISRDKPKLNYLISIKMENKTRVGTIFVFYENIHRQRGIIFS